MDAVGASGRFGEDGRRLDRGGPDRRTVDVDGDGAGVDGRHQVGHVLHHLLRRLDLPGRPAISDESPDKQMRWTKLRRARLGGAVVGGGLVTS